MGTILGETACRSAADKMFVEKKHFCEYNQQNCHAQTGSENKTVSGYFMRTEDLFSLE